jgi:hypothetical protein
VNVREVSDYLFDTAQLLADRLERLSADSIWAHKASGVRGSLLRLIDHHNRAHEPAVDNAQLHSLLIQGFDILEKAALEYYRDKVPGNKCSIYSTKPNKFER